MCAHILSLDDPTNARRCTRNACGTSTSSRPVVPLRTIGLPGDLVVSAATKSYNENPVLLITHAVTVGLAQRWIEVELPVNEQQLKYRGISEFKVIHHCSKAEILAAPVGWSPNSRHVTPGFTKAGVQPLHPDMILFDPCVPVDPCTAPAPHRAMRLSSMPNKSSEEQNKNGWGGKRTGAGRHHSTLAPPPAKTRVLGPPLRQSESARHLQLSTGTFNSFFGPYNTHQHVPLGNPVISPLQTAGPSLWSTVRTSSNTAALQHAPNETQNQSSNSHISLDDFTQLNQQLDYIDEHDEHGDIAAGDQIIDESLIDQVLDTVEANLSTAEAEKQASEANIDSG
ncbi:hypothetical protein C8R43DRAFT_948267 [Mycena crocata]|nr:hypothetical protein C8R43DRAFT_948267 [Mycena crocata]